MGQLSKLETPRDSYEGNNPCLLNGKESSAFNERGSRSTMKLLQIKIILRASFLQQFCSQTRYYDSPYIEMTLERFL